MGLIYRVAPIVFMGGSLARHGGQNPIEAIRLDAAVVHGPHVWNFAEIYATLDQADGARLVTDEETLLAALTDWARRRGARRGHRPGHGPGSGRHRPGRRSTRGGGRVTRSPRR